MNKRNKFLAILTILFISACRSEQKKGNLNQMIIRLEVRGETAQVVTTEIENVFYKEGAYLVHSPTSPEVFIVVNGQVIFWGDRIVGRINGEGGQKVYLPQLMKFNVVINGQAQAPILLNFPRDFADQNDCVGGVGDFGVELAKQLMPKLRRLQK